MKNCLKSTKGSAMVEAALLFPVIILSAVFLIHVMEGLFSQGCVDMNERASQPLKVERESDFIRKGEMAIEEIL